MATGRLGTANLSAGANTVLYTTPSGNFSVVTVSICNRTNAAITCRMALASTSTPTADEWLEYDTEILPKGVLERTGIVMQANLNLVVYSSAGAVSAVAMGIETPTS